MKIVICGNYGAGNLGDEMILEGILQMLKNAAPRAEITVMSGNPQETAKNYKVKSVEKFPAGPTSFFRFFKSKHSTKNAVKNCDYFILGGGGLFGTLTFKAYIIWGIQAFMAYRYKKPVIMYGQSIGLLNSKFRRFIVRKLFKKAKLIVVRDEDSQKRLQEIGIEQKIYVIPDMAFEKTTTIPAAKRENQIIVALRQMDNLSLLFKKHISNFLDWVIDEKNWEVKFIDFQGGEKQDHYLHQEIISILDNPSRTHFIRDKSEILTEFAKSKMVLGMRLHSLVCAIKTQTPFIAVNYAPKIKAFLKYADLDQYLLDIEDIDSDKLIKFFKENLKKSASISKKLQQFNHHAQEEHSKMEKILKNMFFGDGR